MWKSQSSSSPRPRMFKELLVQTRVVLRDSRVIAGSTSMVDQASESIWTRVRWQRKKPVNYEQWLIPFGSEKGHYQNVGKNGFEIYAGNNKRRIACPFDRWVFTVLIYMGDETVLNPCWFCFGFFCKENTLRMRWGRLRYFSPHAGEES